MVSSHRLLCAVCCVFETTYSESHCNMYIRTEVCGTGTRRRRCLTHSSQKITRNINNTALTLPNCHPLQKRPKTQFNVTKKKKDLKPAQWYAFVHGIFNKTKTTGYTVKKSRFSTPNIVLVFF